MSFRFASLELQIPSLCHDCDLEQVLAALATLFARVFSNPSTNGMNYKTSIWYFSFVSVLCRHDIEFNLISPKTGFTLLKFPWQNALPFIMRSQRAIYRSINSTLRVQWPRNSGARNGWDIEANKRSFVRLATTYLRLFNKLRKLFP